MGENVCHRPWRAAAVVLLVTGLAVLTTPRSTEAANSAACAGIQVGVNDDLSSLVDSRPDYSTFCVSAGLHRLSRPVHVKGHDAIIGAPGAILDGSRLLTTFMKAGQYWIAPQQTEENSYMVGQCAPSYPVCQRSDDVFVDDHPLRRVSALGQVVAGTFFFDYAADRIYLADDPTGHKVEVAVVGPGLYGDALGHAQVSGLVVQKFLGVGIRGTDWLIQGNEVRFNHRIGIAVAANGIIRNNYVHDNGQLGIGMTGDERTNIIVEGNEIAHNNYAGYCPCWESGGIKYTQTVGLTVRNNNVHNNFGPGIWIDYDNNNVVIDANKVEANTDEGVIIEASFNVAVHDNLVKDNGLRMDPTWMQGAGIVNQSSANVDVYGNTVDGNLNGIGATQRARGRGAFGAREVANFRVYGNVIIMRGGQSGLVETTGDSTYYKSKGNRYWGNRYVLGCQEKPFIWKDPLNRASYRSLSTAEWVAAGNDPSASVSVACP